MTKSTNLLGKTVTINNVTYVVDRLHNHTNKVGLTAKHITKFKTVPVSKVR
jgi:hypothetical protein